MCGTSFVREILIIQLWVVFQSVVLCLPVLIMEISVEADRTTLSDSLLYTGIFPSRGGVSVCKHTDGVVHLFGELIGADWDISP